MADTRSLDRHGIRWIAAGAGFGVAGAVFAFVVPFVLIELSRRGSTGGSFGTADLVGWTSWSLLIGAALLFLSFFSYRWAYSVLRKADPSYWAASGLCIVGSSGLILIAASAAIAAGNEGSLLSCLQGSYSHVYSCVVTASPIAGYAAVLGVWLAWIGSIGIVTGLFQAGGRYLVPLYVTGAVAYLVTIVLLVGPLAGMFLPVPYVEVLLGIVPALAVAAPAMVLLGRPTLPSSRAP